MNGLFGTTIDRAKYLRCDSRNVKSGTLGVGMRGRRASGSLNGRILKATVVDALLAAFEDFAEKGARVGRWWYFMRWEHGVAGRILPRIQGGMCLVGRGLLIPVSGGLATSGLNRKSPVTLCLQ